MKTAIQMLDKLKMLYKLFYLRNLKGNLNAAYERHFLFKIKFESPTVEVKSKIWKSKLPWIDADFAQKRAHDFSFSGGEIDNIVRKVIIQEVLQGKKPKPCEIYRFYLTKKGLSNRRRIKIEYL